MHESDDVRNPKQRRGSGRRRTELRHVSAEREAHHDSDESEVQLSGRLADAWIGQWVETRFFPKRLEVFHIVRRSVANTTLAIGGAE